MKGATVGGTETMYLSMCFTLRLVLVVTLRHLRISNRATLHRLCLGEGNLECAAELLLCLNKEPRGNAQLLMSPSLSPASSAESHKIVSLYAHMGTH